MLIHAESVNTKPNRGPREQCAVFVNQEQKAQCYVSDPAHHIFLASGVKTLKRTCRGLVSGSSLIKIFHF